jgi:hypothetical protein
MQRPLNANGTAVVAELGAEPDSTPALSLVMPSASAVSVFK